MAYSRSHCGMTGVILGLCNSIEVIISDTVLAAASSVRLRTEAKQDL